MIDIEDVKRLTLGPDDILVVQVKGHFPSEAIDRMTAYIREGFPVLKNRIMVIEDGVTLAVLTAEEAKLRA